ncbi:HDL105Cp [Eremothecium sinecaudum]|uniref:HDL105Cp n=1 Tax=Eremothecium sinecaudum TaxID=45286 RepID=A0A0X8HSF9_9SACH|nr:HDL105Cp [Eremothecium sinecaudum]AMD20639.1 HDL105Cp [Eremothecium sinecaudum]
MLPVQSVLDFTQVKLATIPAGYLPKWLLFISIVSVLNSMQAYVNKDITKRVYEGKPSETTALSARTFGTWTLVSSVIRLYGAFHLNEEHIYQLTFISYVIALLHFGSEWLIFRTCKLGKGLTGPLVVSSLSLFWMYTQKEYYTGLAW